MISPDARLLKLLTWLTPAFAAGAFGSARDLEAAIRAGSINDARDLTVWISEVIEHGDGWSDAVLAKAAWTAVTAEDHVALDQIAALAENLITSPLRRRESLAQGEAFLTAVAAWNPPPILSAPYPVALGATAGAAGIPLEPALAAWLHAYAVQITNLATRALRLGPSEALAVVANLERVILRTSARVVAASPTELDEHAYTSRTAVPRRVLPGR